MKLRMYVTTDEKHIASLIRQWFHAWDPIIARCVTFRLPTGDVRRRESSGARRSLMVMRNETNLKCLLAEMKLIFIDEAENETDEIEAHSYVSLREYLQNLLRGADRED